MVYKLINIITDIINNISFILCILSIIFILSNNIFIYFYLFLFIIFYKKNDLFILCIIKDK